MQSQLNNNVLSSFKLFLENKLLTRGLAYSNTSGHFYDTKDKYNGYYTYSTPFQPLIADQSVPGATIMSGIYLDGVFIRTGQSGLFDINYEKGQVLFTSGVANNRLSGNYSFADYNVKLTSDPDSTLLFENKYFLRSKAGQTLSGIQHHETTYPVIYLRENSSFNKPFAFGGLNETTINIRIIVIADSAFLLDATTSIIRDLKELHVPLLSGAQFPYNAYGGLKTGVYNYTGMTNGHIPGNSAYIDYSDISRFLQSVKTDTKILPDNVFTAFADVGLQIFRYPRN